MHSPATLLFRVAQLLYFMAPAYIANMAPPFVRYWNGWNRPISQRWLGNHKTVMGFGFGVLAAVVVTFVQSRVAWEELAWPDLATILLLSTGGHILINHLGYWIGIRDVKW